MDYISMLYMDWFIILLLAYMAAGLATYMVIGFVPVGRRKRFIFTANAPVLIAIAAFYFLVPVPSIIQNNYIKSVYNLKLNTENPFLFNTSIALDRLCTGHSLKGYQYFMFQKAYREDMDLTFKKSKSGISFSNMDHIVGQDQDKICDMKI